MRELRVVPGIREPLIAKATRHGDLELPLVVAVDAVHRDVRLSPHVDEALFGTETWGLTQAGEPAVRHARDGVWMGPDGPRCRTLSAVLVAERMDPWHLAYRRTMLFDNPWARHPTAGLDFGVDALRWSDPTIPLETIGRSLREVLGLPERWPKE